MRPQDLNLLMVFDAIMTEKSITRAAARLAMTQPAVSNSVSRMRVAWKDDLFVKDGRNIQPTLYSQNLWRKIKQPLSQLADAVDPKRFDPKTAKRTFRIAIFDIAVDIVFAPLRKILEELAPGINIIAVPYTITNTEQILKDAEVDLVIGGRGITSSSYRSEYIFSPTYLCVMRNGHPLAKANLKLEEFAAADHLFVSLSGDTTSYTDQVLMQHNLTRTISMSVNHFSAVSKLVSKSNLISVVPAIAVFDAIINNTIAATLLPLELMPEQVLAIWHERQDRDAGLTWLRAHMTQIIKDQVELNTKLVLQKLSGR